VQINSLQANLQRLRTTAGSVKDRREQAAVLGALSEATSIMKGVGPGGDL
jgi:hypothetical protein